MVSDETAYRKYLAGDEAAAQLLVERYGDALTLYINGVLGDIHEAEDLMIEAFAHIFARERPIQDGCFKAYLYKTGRNLALRCKTRRRFFLPLEELPFELPDEALAETGSLQNEQHQQLYAALGKLKKEYRETLFLVYFEELLPTGRTGAGTHRAAGNEPCLSGQAAAETTFGTGGISV